MTGHEDRYTITVGGDRPDPEPGDRLPLEHARALDTICAELRPNAQLLVSTESAALLQAVVNRHDHLLVTTKVPASVQVPDAVSISTVDDGPDPTRVLIVEPTSIETVEASLDRRPDVPHDCLVGNPLSYNRVADRAVHGWLSPRKVAEAYRSRGYETFIEGYHGPRSLLASVRGRVLASDPAARDRYTHRMQAAYREQSRMLALLSCLVHISAPPGAT